MTLGRLNHLMLLHVHKDRRTKSLEEAEVARRFVAGSEHSFLFSEGFREIYNAPHWTYMSNCIPVYKV